MFLGILAGGGCGGSETAGEDQFTVRLGVEGEGSAASSGWVRLFLITAEGGRRWEDLDPLDGPFYSEPQPIASFHVDDFKSGDRVVFADGAAGMAMFGGPFDALTGRVRMQAIFDCDTTERSQLDGPGNVYSGILTFQADSSRADTHELVLTNVVERAVDAERVEGARVSSEVLSIPSRMLSEFYGRPMNVRVGVAYPPSYWGDEDPDESRGLVDRSGGWPAVYVIPGFGGRADEVDSYGEMFRARGISELAPMAVHIVLDPESPLGHHGFVDSPNHGPRGTSLVEEIIPELERRLNLDARASARVVTGHSSGGWSSLWLQLRWPEVFGGCWSSAPDPVDFSAFQMTNLYSDTSLFEMPDGGSTPSFREFVPGNTMVVRMTVREEHRMEHAMATDGSSGEQWDAWEAMFSQRDATTGLPKPLCDARTGVIDRTVVESWSKFDIVRLVREDWERYGPLLRGRVRLACGTHDSFYLNRAVERLSALIDKRSSGAASGPGYVLMVPNEDHGSVTSRIFMRWNEEMRAHFEQNGYPQRIFAAE